MGATTTKVRSERAALIALVAGLLLSLIWLVHPWYDATNDGAMYIATTRSLLAGEGFSMLGSPFLIRPPGFSVLLAPLLAAFGTNFGVLNLFVSLWGVAAVVLFYLWLKPRTGCWLALVAALALWLNPGFQRLCNQVMSDVPGVTLLLACLLLERHLARKPSAKSDLLLGLAIGGAALVRSVCVLLLPAILVARIVRRGEQPWRVLGLRAAALIAGTLALQGPWSLRNTVVAPPPPADQTMLYSYGTGMWHENKGDPTSPRLPLGDVLGRFAERRGQIETTLGNRLTGSELELLTSAGAAVLLLCLAVSLVKRRRTEDFFCLAVLGLLAIYFNFAPRLLLPAYVLMFGTAAELVRSGVARFRGERIATVLSCALVGSIGLKDLVPRRDWEAIERGHQQLTELARRFEEHLEADDVVASFRGWHYAVALDRPVYSLQFGFVRGGGPAGAEELIDKYGIEKVVLSPIVELERQFVPYFRAKYPVTGKDEALVFQVR